MKKLINSILFVITITLVVSCGKNEPTVKGFHFENDFENNLSSLKGFEGQHEVIINDKYYHIEFYSIAPYEYFGSLNDWEYYRTNDINQFLGEFEDSKMIENFNQFTENLGKYPPAVQFAKLTDITHRIKFRDSLFKAKEKTAKNLLGLDKNQRNEIFELFFEYDMLNPIENVTLDEKTFKSKIEEDSDVFWGPYRFQCEKGSGMIGKSAIIFENGIIKANSKDLEIMLGEIPLKTLFKISYNEIFDSIVALNNLQVNKGLFNLHNLEEKQNIKELNSPITFSIGYFSVKEFISDIGGISHSYSLKEWEENLSEGLKQERLKEIDYRFSTTALKWNPDYIFTCKEPPPPSPACQCASAMSGINQYKLDEEQKIQCKMMYKCFGNANADCSLGTENVWEKCEDLF